MKHFKWVLISLPIICIVVLGTIMLLILYYKNTARPQKSDVIIVLGCQVQGRTPSLSLDYRLRKALELYNQKYAEHIIVSGGQGRDEAASEAEVMAGWLTAHGVDPEAIHKESRSTSTYENEKYSKQIMDENNYSSAIIVTNDFHIFRSLLIAKKLGIKASAASARSVGFMVTTYLYAREVLSVIKYTLLGK